jgi:hypothetical protein
MIRQSTKADVPEMVGLSARKRKQYAEYSPVFWRMADGASNLQRAFFDGLVVDPSWICLVHENGNGISGFIIAHVTTAPPVYDPGGKVCIIDDFAVAKPTLWATVGMALQGEAERRAAVAGAVISIIVCGQRDIPKRNALLDSGSELASEWYVRPIKAID